MSATGRRTSQLERLLAILGDGREHTQVELYREELGAVHSVVHTARRRGHPIEHRVEWRDGIQLHWYRLGATSPVDDVDDCPTCQGCGASLGPVTGLCAERCDLDELFDDELGAQFAFDDGWAA
jgi:hypothetical protein